MAPRVRATAMARANSSRKSKTERPQRVAGHRRVGRPGYVDSGQPSRRTAGLADRCISAEHASLDARCLARRRRHCRAHRAAADRYSFRPDRRGAPGAGHPLVAAADDVLGLPGRRLGFGQDAVARRGQARAVGGGAQSATGEHRATTWHTRRASSAPRRRSRNGRRTLPPRSMPGSRRRSSPPRRRTCARSWCRASTSPTARSSGWRRCSRRDRAV